MSDPRVGTRRVKRTITEDEEFTPHESEVRMMQDRHDAERDRLRAEKESRELSDRVRRYLAYAGVAAVCLLLGAFALWLITTILL